jgi:hypothetical protein
MKDDTTPIGRFFAEVGDYSKIKMELLELYVIEKIAYISSFLIARLVLLLIVVLFFLTISIGFALWIGQLLGRSYYGFFVVGSLYLPVLVLLYIYRDRWIETPVNNSIILKFFKKNWYEK